MIALVTADAARGLDPDLHPLAEHLAHRLGDHAVRIVSWDDADVDWGGVEAAVIRSTWDYTERLDEFLSWIDRVGASTRLVNPPALVRWNADKHYLADLAAEGVAIAPTAFVPPGEAPPQVATAEPDGTPHDDVVVVKPTVGAGSAGARRCVGDEIAEHVALLHASGRTAMVQPYLRGLDDHGETALCFVSDGRGGLDLSHAFRKGAILTSADVEQVGGLFAKEEITPREPTVAEETLARRALDSRAVRSRGTPFFARVDIAPNGGDRDDAHALVVMELELIEPSFYFDVEVGTASRFAAALAAEFGATRADEAS